MPQILSHTPRNRRTNLARAFTYAAEHRRVGLWRIALEVVLLARGKGGLRPEDYFREGAWRPGLRLPERRGFVGQKASDALNLVLNPRMRDERPVTEDKLASRLPFAAAGLPQGRLLAVASAEPVGGDTRWLRGPEDTLAFLSDPQNLPCFGKPVHGSNGIGAVSVIACEDGNRLRLGNGQSVSAEALVVEIWAEHARGYMFQELIRPHPDLAGAGRPGDLHAAGGDGRRRRRAGSALHGPARAGAGCDGGFLGWTDRGRSRRWTR